MIIIVNQILVSKLDPECQITIISFPEELLIKINKTNQFIIGDSSTVFESNMMKRFPNSLCGFSVKGQLTDTDTIIIAVKSRNGYNFNQLVLNK